MKVNVNDNWYIEIDSFGNHTPYSFKKGGEEIVKGKYKGQITQDRWVSEGKYFVNLPQALLYIFHKELSMENEEMDIKEYIEQAAKIHSKITKFIQKYDTLN